MTTLSIVEDLDVLEDRVARLCARDEIGVEDEVVLQRREEALSDGVVPAIALATHALHDAVLFERAAIVGARVLAAAIGVVHEAARRTTRAERHRERRERQL